MVIFGLSFTETFAAILKRDHKGVYTGFDDVKDHIKLVHPDIRNENGEKYHLLDLKEKLVPDDFYITQGYLRL